MNSSDLILKSATRDFLNASAQRSRWSRNEPYLAVKLEEYDQILQESWLTRFEFMKDGLINCNKESSKIKAGKKLYKETMEKMIPIDNQYRPFIMKGSYHMLANDLKIGWHVDYEKLIGKEK